MGLNKSGKPSILVMVVDQLRFNYVSPRRMPRVAGLLKSRNATLHECDGNMVPTITETIHATISTSEYPASHGIIGKEWFSRRSRMVQEFDPLDMTEVSTLSLAAASNGYAVYAVGGKPHAAQIVGTPYARYILAPGHSPKSGSLILQNYAHPPELPSWVPEIDRARDVTVLRQGSWLGIRKTPDYDQWIARVAQALMTNVEKEEPVVLFVLLSALDFVGHEYLPGSKEHAAVLRNIDELLVALTEYAQQTLGQDTIILTLGDHGVRTIQKGVFMYMNVQGPRFREFTIDQQRRAYTFAPAEMAVPEQILPLIAHVIFDGGVARFWASDPANIMDLLRWAKTQFATYGKAYCVWLPHTLPNAGRNGAHTRLGDIILVANEVSGFLKKEWIAQEGRIIVGEHGTWLKSDRIVPCLVSSGRSWLSFGGRLGHKEVSTMLRILIGQPRG